ncbi:putative manganese transporter [Anaerofustis butyriciformans]|uniref:putative manganese transporter n=1 Tax=Anaerofustis butyriciformans TaxID=3108533 RepID=UPI003F8C671C
MLLHSLEHAFTDSIKIFPFLLITYIILEFIEHKTEDKFNKIIEKAGIFGPIVGAVLGAIPQCGFSTAASNFYAGRIISLGTLIAIFLSTSDEMLPIMIASAAPISLILKIIFSKVVIGIFFGLIIDILLRKSDIDHKVNMGHSDNHMHDDCKEEESFLFSAIKHTINIFIFIFIFTFILNIFIEFIGEENLSNIILNKPIIGSLIAGIVGLIPNCAGSVIITNLYLSGGLGFGAMMSGLLVSAGVGLLVLFKVNKDRKENIKILIFLYLIGSLCGIIIDLFSNFI